MGDPARKPEGDDELSDSEHGDEWEAEIDRRIEDVRSGRVKLIPHEQVMAEIDERLAARRTRSARTR